MSDRLMTDAYHEGVQAAAEKQAREACPYSPGTASRWEWECGFDNEVTSWRDPS